VSGASVIPKTAKLKKSVQENSKQVGKDEITPAPNFGEGKNHFPLDTRQGASTSRMDQHLWFLGQEKKKAWEGVLSGKDSSTFRGKKKIICCTENRLAGTLGQSADES